MSESFYFTKFATRKLWWQHEIISPRFFFFSHISLSKTNKHNCEPRMSARESPVAVTNLSVICETAICETWFCHCLRHLGRSACKLHLLKRIPGCNMEPAIGLQHWTGCRETPKSAASDYSSSLPRMLKPFKMWGHFEGLYHAIVWLCESIRALALKQYVPYE